MGGRARTLSRAACARRAGADRHALGGGVGGGGPGAGRGGAAGGRAQRQAGRRRGRAGRARRGDRQHHDRHQHGRARHRHSLVGRRARGRRPARHPDRAARVRPHRPPARRPQRPPGRSRPCRGHPVAGGRRAGQRQEQPLVAADGCAAGDELPRLARRRGAGCATRRRAPKENWPANAAAWCPRTKNWRIPCHFPDRETEVRRR